MSLSAEDDFYREAEERLERRLAEDRAREMGFLRIQDDDHDEGFELDNRLHDRETEEEMKDGEEEMENNEGGGDTGVHWSDVIYDDSIVDENLALRMEDEEAGGHSDESPHGTEEGVRKERGRRPSSAMSELDLLVKESLVLGQRAELLSPMG